MAMTRKLFRAFVLASTLLSSGVALAQDPGASGAAPSDQAVDSEVGEEEIIVTARLRAETAFEVPVVLQAVGSAELQRRSIVNVDGIARITPLVIIGDNASSAQGAPIAIRGFSGADLNPFADQPASFNIDGIQVARSTVQRLSSMDIEQVEVLKGPQTLFFGKNSPAGVISIRTADPTDTLQAKFSSGYEFKADELRLDGYVSAPITDTLGIRVAGYYRDIKGFVRNAAVPTGGATVASRRAPDGYEYATRVTLKFEPSDTFDARLKFSYNKGIDGGPGYQNEIVACPTGVAPGRSANVDCKANFVVSVIDPGASFEAIDPTRRGGAGFLDRDQILASLEMNQAIAESVTLTSITGLYRYQGDSLYNALAQDLPGTVTAAHDEITFRDFSQEIRILTKFDGIFNFSGGANYQSSLAEQTTTVVVGAGGSAPATPAFRDGRSKQKGEAYSVFGQVMIKPNDLVDLAAGGRWSHEEKDLINSVAGVPQISAIPSQSWSNFSPEVTLAVHPTRNVNLFASYRTGFLSGGFNGGSKGSYTGLDLTYDQQKIKGFEIGAKARLFDGALRINAAYFNYKVTGLQVSVANGIVVTLGNAGEAYMRGFELDGNWRTPIEGLTLRGALAYNKSRYNVFTFGCYDGQSVGQGCNLGLNPVTGRYTLQDLAGQHVARSPDWAGNAGLNYETAFGDYKIGLAADANYTSWYYSNSLNAPLTRQKSYWLADASFRFGAADDKWEVALIGRNIGNKTYVPRTAQVSGTGGLSGTATANTQDAIMGIPGRGREVMLQLTIRPDLF